MLMKQSGSCSAEGSGQKQTAQSVCSGCHLPETRTSPKVSPSISQNASWPIVSPGNAAKFLRSAASCTKLTLGSTMTSSIGPSTRCTSGPEVYAKHVRNWFQIRLRSHAGTQRKRSYIRLLRTRESLHFLRGSHHQDNISYQVYMIPGALLILPGIIQPKRRQKNSRVNNCLLASNRKDS